MMTRLTIFISIVFMTFSCNKEEQSCSDGIFTPEKEQKVDCGGVCPPCDFTPTVIDEFLRAKVNGESITFDNYSLSKTPDWILTFQNDSLYVNLNFGSGDSLGGRPISSTYSNGILGNENYSNLNTGTVVFAEIDHTENLLSGFFTAKFISNTNVYDTLAITSAEFAKINW